MFSVVVALPCCQQALLFRSTEIGYMPDEGDELPDILLSVDGTKGGHAGGHNAM
jgi:hypothetical protein